MRKGVPAPVCFVCSAEGILSADMHCLKQDGGAHNFMTLYVFMMNRHWGIAARHDRRTSIKVEMAWCEQYAIVLIQDAAELYATVPIS